MTNPTERPEGKTPFQRVTDELTGGCGCACHTGTGYNTACSHCRPTERPEERDSLAEKPLPSNAQVASWSSYLHRVIGVDDENANHVLSDLADTASTLINEVKERRAEQNRSLYDVDVRDRRITELEAEVEDLRDENARLRKREPSVEEKLREAKPMTQAGIEAMRIDLTDDEAASFDAALNEPDPRDTRIKQMEEALRGVRFSAHIYRVHEDANNALKNIDAIARKALG